MTHKYFNLYHNTIKDPVIASVRHLPHSHTHSQPNWRPKLPLLTVSKLMSQLQQNDDAKLSPRKERENKTGNYENNYWVNFCLMSTNKVD